MMSEVSNTTTGLVRSFWQWLIADRRRVIGAVLLLVILYWSRCYSSRPVDNSVLNLSEGYRKEVLKSIRQSVFSNAPLPETLYNDDFQSPDYIWERIQDVRDKVRELPYETHKTDNGDFYLVHMPPEFGRLAPIEQIVLTMNVRINSVDYGVGEQVAYAWEDDRRRVRLNYNGLSSVLADDGQGLDGRKKMISGLLEAKYLTNKKELYEILRDFPMMKHWYR